MQGVHQALGNRGVKSPVVQLQGDESEHSLLGAAGLPEGR
jgi:hypothetical protein